ncbi:hypothetical protein TNIN_454311 [Trichonephila inaurata madagascariensis]|uniref:Uncharacterized protein n=1 Tax=Trichonephila inaurata madagascariensis TaxID=2747483 RepID=A0A8X7CJY0_9ARAC|nr:hypothetical protein TNIN_454311 [Trichonephila inaurata madagascariensis]
MMWSLVMQHGLQRPDGSGECVVGSTSSRHVQNLNMQLQRLEGRKVRFGAESAGQFHGGGDSVVGLRIGVALVTVIVTIGLENEITLMSNSPFV